MQGNFPYKGVQWVGARRRREIGWGSYWIWVVAGRVWYSRGTRLL